LVGEKGEMEKKKKKKKGEGAKKSQWLHFTAQQNPYLFFAPLLIILENRQKRK
jgi:hypothetical protein